MLAEKQKLGRRSRQKGKRNELELARIIAAHFGYSINPADAGKPEHYLSHCRRTARSHQNKTGDHFLSEELAAKFPFVIEAKARESWSFDAIMRGECAAISKWWEQAVAQSYGVPNRFPLLAFTKNRNPWYVAVQSCSMGLTSFVETGGFLVLSKPPVLITTLENFLEFRNYGVLNETSQNEK